MAENKNLDADDLDVDELLNFDTDDAVEDAPDVAVVEPVAVLDPPVEKKVPRKTVAPKAPAEAALTADQIRIKELEAQLAVPTPVVEKEELTVELTADQIRIKELEDQLARKNAADLEAAPPVYDKNSGKGATIVLHFVADGFTACGQSWYRGQELEFEVGAIAYEQQKDRNGDSWLDLVDDIDAQYERYGKQFFAPGPWRGKSWDEAPVPADMTDALEIAKYRADLKNAANAERSRGRAAPIMR